MKFKIFLLILIFMLSICGISSASPTLSKNDTGDDVLIVQKKLYLIGYTITEFDGVFRNETERAVLEFQKSQDINATGIVTNATWRALKKAKPVAGRTLSGIGKTSTVKTTEKVQTLFKAPNGSVTAKNGKTFITGREGNAIIATAKKYIGVPYVFGGTNPSGFDCSGFLQYVFNEVGIIIPRLADEQYLLGCSAKVSQLDVGDLVFFSTYMEGASHCGIYLGDRQFLHVSSSRGVRIDSLDSDYWNAHFFGARKIIA